ncbi:MAG: laccase domain-containing protein [Solirubrobacterales bacterium]|nr:laccase domain-containing protein [Solirubrobacterales bacterium]
MNWREADGVPWLEADLAGEATVVFSTREGGVSRGPFESLNLGILTDDRREHVLENRLRLATAAGFDTDRVSMGRQVHEAGLGWAGPEIPGSYSSPGPEPPPEADGQLTDESLRPLLVLVADCLPVALLGERGLGMLHCGWRGLVAGIIEAAAGEVGARAAAVGPGIGPCCFEVGPEVEAAFAGLGPGLMNGRNLDLPEVARRLLARAGVEQVDSADICTYCDRRFFSHRRDRGKTGRQAGIAWLR